MQCSKKLRRSGAAREAAREQADEHVSTLRAISSKLHQSGCGSSLSGVIMGVSSVDQTFQLFSECWLFRNLERREKEALFTRVKIRDFAAGETIFVVGSPGDSGMILLDGTVQISLPGQPHAALLSTPGDIFGEIALLDGKER